MEVAMSLAEAVPVRLSVVYQDVGALKPRPTNPRTHSRKQIAQIAKAIRRFGFINPILVDDANFMIAGHGRLEGAKAVGLDQVPTVRARARYVLTSSQITGLRKTPDGHVEVNVEFGKVLQF